MAIIVALFLSVFPARAGVILAYDAVSDIGDRVPRTSGGNPLILQFY